MSRTFRRKGYEDTQRSSWDREGNKIAGYYTQWHYTTKCHETDAWYWWERNIWYAEPTDAEYNKAYGRIHRESKNRNVWSPNRHHRLFRMRQNRMINKQELNKWLTREDYEPLFEADPRNCWWDWD